MDYGVDRADILNCLNTLGTNNDAFVRRSERMWSIALPIKMWHYSISNDEFDRYNHDRKHNLQHNLILETFFYWFRIMEKHKDKQIVMASTDRMNERNSNKNLIVNELKMLLECNDTEASELYYNHVNSVDELGWAKENIKFLLEISVSRRAIWRHGSILTLPFGELPISLHLFKFLLMTNLWIFQIKSKTTLKLSWKWSQNTLMTLSRS